MTKMDDGLPIVGPTVDMSQAPAINQKRTLAFINHFISHTVQFLNKFSGACEEKLADIQMRIQRLEVTLSILEAKISSIPGLENITASASAIDTAPKEVDTNKSQAQVELQAEPPVEAEKPAEIPVMTVSKDPRYAKYFKMLMVGVPAPAVKTKMNAEGLDADLLDTPDAPAPITSAQKSDNDYDDSDDDASSFTDSD